MIVYGHLMLPDGPSGVQLREGWLRIDGGRITEVHAGQRPASFDQGGDRTVVCPGFIDVHVHLPQFDIIGAHGLTLLEWLQQVTFPAEQKWVNATYAAAATGRAIDQLFAAGTTGIAAFATVHPEATTAAIEVCRDRSMRAAVGQVLMDREAPAELTPPAEVQLRSARDFLERFGTSGRVCYAVTPRFAVSCSDRLLRGAGELACAFTALVQTHLAETTDECDLVRQKFGKPYLQVYEDAGLLTSRTVLGHGIHLQAEDRALLRQRNSVIAHCPTANTFLRSGTMNRKALVESAVRMGLGSDIGGGYECCMVRVARAMIESATFLGHDSPTASAAWWQITQGNSQALGWESGHLTAGADADLVLVEPTISWQEHPDPLSMLLFAWDDRWVRETIAAGQVVFASRD